MSITKQNYVLVDFENVQAIDPEKLKDLPVKVVLFVGQHQKSISMEVFRKACALPGCFEVVEAVGTGTNALDFQIACYAGRLAEREPTAFIHFLSKDKGFDVVVQYLKSQKRWAARADSFNALLFFAPKQSAKDMSHEQRVQHVEACLKKMPGTTRPRKLKTLRSAAHSMLRKEVEEPEVARIVDLLKERGRVLVGPEESVSYQFDPSV